MRNLTNEEKEELQRKIQDEQVKRTQKRWSTKAYLTVLILLGLGAGWWSPEVEWEVLPLLLRVIAAVVAILVALWVYQDAKKRSMRSVVWALFTLFFSPIVLVLYLLETQAEPPVASVERSG
jgi:hypothetical protein